MRLTWCVLCLAAVVLTVDGGRSGGRSSGGGSRSSGSRSSSGGYSSGSRSYGGSSSSRGYGSGSTYTKPSSSHTSSSGYGGSSSHISGSNTHYGGSSGTKPQTANTHYTQSHVIPVSTGARTPIKPTTRPQVYQRNTPRPIVHPKPTQPHHTTRHNSTSGGGGYHHGSSTGRHNSTSGGIGFHQGSTGGKVNDHVQQSHVPNQQSAGMNPHAPSAPPLPTGSNPHSPSAPPLPGAGSHQPGHQPPGPGWQPGVTNDAAQKQNINNLNNQYPGAPPPYSGGAGNYPNQAPPPYSGSGGQYPNQAPPPYSGGAGHYPNQPPPPYSGSGGHYPNQPPPPYSGSGGHYPNQPAPPYSGGHYPNQAPPPYSGGAGYNPTQHYPVQSGGPVYHQQYHPPPPPPGYTPYGAPLYREKSGISGSNVVAGLALWELMRSRNHHQHYGIHEVHHHHYQDGSGNYDSTTNYQPTYHDTMRERYTTRTTPNRQPIGPGAYNILEMTHYITPDDKGVISSSEGNMTCITVYNSKSINAWHQRQVKDFERQYPNTKFPLPRLENDTQSENFTVIAGRIIHREPVTITCCGTNKGKLDLNLLTNGKHPDVNCVNHLGHIPIKKLTFVRTQTQTVGPLNVTGWHEIQLRDPNATTPVPLAPFPTNFLSNTSTPTPLAPFPPSLPYSSKELPLPPLAQFPTNFTTSTATPVDMNQTFAPIGARNGIQTVDMKQVFDSLGSNNTTESTIGVTNNPSDLIVE